MSGRDRERLKTSVETIRATVRDNYMGGELTLEQAFEADQNLELTLAAIRVVAPDKETLRKHLLASQKSAAPMGADFDEVLKALPQSEI